MSNNPPPSNMVKATDGHRTIQLRRLTLPQLKRIDALLEQVGDYGELRLKVEKSEVRFVEVVVSRRL